MNESQDRKTEEPTDRRLEDARDEGQIDRSRDVNTALILGTVMLGFWIGRDTLAARMQAMARLALDAPARTAAGDPAAVIDTALILLGEVLLISLPVLALAMLVAIVVSVIQTQGLFAPAALRPQVSRMNPVEGLKNIFSRRSAIEFFKALFKIVYLGFAMFLIIKASLPVLVKLPLLPVSGVAQTASIVFARFFGLAILALALVAVFDYWFQRYDFRYRLRMTREEVKRERRDNEGDPMLRARRKAVARQALEAGDIERIRTASVVLQSAADKLAVALQIPEGASPWLILKGAGHAGDAIVAAANEARVRIVHDASLTRSIYRQTAVSGDLPDKLGATVRRLFA